MIMTLALLKAELSPRFPSFPILPYLATWCASYLPSSPHYLISMITYNPVLAFTIAVVILPITHVVIPIVLAIWAVIKHVLIIPLLLMLRISLFGLIYLPLTPVLMMTGVHHDIDVPVEVSLFRLAVALLPHAEFFFINMLHYVMIAVFVGIICGAVAAIYVTIISKLFTLPSSKEIQSLVKKQALKAPIIAQALEAFESHALDVVAKAEAFEAKVKQEPKIEETSSKPVPEFLENTPIIKREPIAPLRFTPVATGEGSYEDDDGYTYMTFGSDSQGEEYLDLPRRPSMAPIEEESDETSKPPIIKEEEEGHDEAKIAGDEEERVGGHKTESGIVEGEEELEEVEEQNEVEADSAGDEENQEVKTIEEAKDVDTPLIELTSGGIEKLENALTETPEVIVTRATTDTPVKEEEEEEGDNDKVKTEPVSSHLEPHHSPLEVQLESKLKTKLDKKLKLSNQILKSDPTSEASEISEQSEEVSDADSLVEEFSDSHGSPHLLDDGHQLRTLDSIYSVTNTLFSRADAATLHSEYISDDDK